MKYNTSLEPLIIPEYGRCVQQLIQHAKTLEDDEYRQAFVEKVVRLMTQMNPQTKVIDDYLHRIWSHVFKIAEYDLKVTPPMPVPTSAEEAKVKPSQVPYPQIKMRYRHYGKNVHTMIKKAVAMEDPEKKIRFTEVIAAYMKMAFKTWNREVVSDDIIKNDLETLSKNQLTFELGKTNIDSLLLPNKSRIKSPKHHKGHSKNYKKNKNYKRKKY